MTTSINVSSKGNYAGAVAHPKPEAHATTTSREYLSAERNMRRGKGMVVSGFIVAVVGIVGYCVACLNAAVDPVLGASFFENPGWLVGPALATIGLGTLMWLVGSFVYLNGAMDSDPDGGPDLQF